MLYIHTSNHLEQLKKQYANLIKTPLKDVLQTETVVVQNAGMARWLSMEMAETEGISANTEYLFPAEFMWRLLRLVSSDIPEHSECAPDTLRFHIYDELITHIEAYPELHHYILTNGTMTNDVDNTKCNKDHFDHLSTWELSCQCARLLDQYLFYRSEWIQQWENDTSTETLNHSDHWQARLWNRCVKEKHLLHWLSLQDKFSRDIDLLDMSLLEERICFFSMSALSPGYIDLLEGISQKTDIHIFIINPCGDVYWGDIQSPKSHAKLDQTEQQYSEIGNPLLASLGKQGRDFIDKLISIQDQQSSDDYLYHEIDENINDNEQSITLLSQIQNDIYHLEAPELISNFDQTDDSIQFHSCHTAMREVEVLHDQILAQLDADADLTPSDIVVMMPDIEKYAPYIESIFTQAISSKKQKLPFSIADRDAQNIFKIIQALNKLFCLPDSRFDVEAVFELLEYDEICSHFGLNQEQLKYCRELALATNIRWGISAKSRQQNNLPNTEEHTWKYALDSMLLGYALSSVDNRHTSEQNNTDQLFDSERHLKLLPYIEIEGGNTLVLAKFKQFTDTIFAIDDWQKQSHSLEQWIEKTKKLLQLLSTESSDQQRIFKSLEDIKVKANLAKFKQELSFAVFQKILQQGLSEISANEKFLGYGITFCALVPMRSVPFKIVVLMGMNDAEFPRQDTRPSFDLMSNKMRRGDRSRRDEDRYLFLESILAARNKLIVSYIGQSIKDNTELPPSILVSELLDTISVNSGIKSNDWIIKHPLQAFSQRYFQTHPKNNYPLFSYASQYLTLDQQLQDKTARDNQSSNPLFISKALESLGDEHKKITLNELITFFKNPARAFLKMRFGIQTYNDNQELSIREPFEIESFKERDLRSIALTTCSDETDKPLIARAKGLLPYGEIGDAIYAKEKHIVDIFKQQLPELEQQLNEYISLTIGDYELSANIDQLTDIGRCVTQLSKPYTGDYISLWITHLCLNASAKDSNDASTQTQFYSPEKSFQLRQVEDATEQLNQLLDYYWNGLHFPLHFFPKSSFALYSKKGTENFQDMSAKWNGDDRYAGEKDSFEHSLLHRNLVMNKEKQDEEFIHSSYHFFGKLFLSFTEL